MTGLGDFDVPQRSDPILIRIVADIVYKLLTESKVQARRLWPKTGNPTAAV